MRWLKYTFLYGQPVTHMRHPRQASWSTSTMPSSLRLYIAPDGHAATCGVQAVFTDARQVEHERLLELHLDPIADLVLDLLDDGVVHGQFRPPLRSSSQFADHSIFMGLPVINDFGRATGVCSPSGAEIRLS